MEIVFQTLHHRLVLLILIEGTYFDQHVPQRVLLGSDATIIVITLIVYPIAKIDMDSPITKIDKM